MGLVSVILVTTLHCLHNKQELGTIKIVSAEGFCSSVTMSQTSEQMNDSHLQQEGFVRK